MKDLRQNIGAGQTGVLESILNAIPGYGGYRDKQLRRDADRVLREHVVQELDQELRKLGEVQRRLVGNRLDLVDDLDRVVRELQTARDRVRTAAGGYSGFFDLVKVREEELARLYEYDQALLAEISSLHEGTAAIATAADSNTGVEEAIRDLGEAVARLTDYWRRRREAMLDL